MLIKGHYFPGQKRTEKVVLFIRRHWVTYVPWVLLVVLLILLPWIINGIFNILGISLIDIYNDLVNITETSANDIWINYVTIMVLSSYYLFLVAYFLKMWIDYYLDIIIVTPEHLANIQQIGLLNHKVSEQSLLRVQDVTARVDGFWQTFFRYGTVVAETAGDEPNFSMRDVPNPNSVATTILKLHEELIESGGLEEELSEGIGVERPKPVAKKRKEMVNKVVYNLPPNKGVNIESNNHQAESKRANQEESSIRSFDSSGAQDRSIRQAQDKEKTIDLEDSRVVIIQTPKSSRAPSKKIPAKDVFGEKTKKVEKVAPSLPKSENTDIESSWLGDPEEKKKPVAETKKLDKSKSRKSTKTEEGELKEGEEIKL